MSDSQRQPPQAGNGRGQPQTRVRGREAGRARAGEPEPPRSSVGANATAGEIGDGRTGAPPAATLPPPVRTSGLPPPPTAWSPPRAAPDASMTWSPFAQPPAAPANPPAAVPARATPPAADPDASMTWSPFAQPAPAAGTPPGSTPAATPPPAPVPATTPEPPPPAHATAPMAAIPADTVPAAPAPAERRGDSFDDFAQEGPPVAELTGERTVPTERPARGDPTALMSDTPDPTQVVREHTGDLPRRNGVLGDLRYLVTALAGAIRSVKQVRALRAKLEVEREARKGLVLVMARELLGHRDADVEAVREARALLDEAETERARHAADVAALAAEIAALEENGDAESLAAEAEVGRIVGAIADIDREIVDLERLVAAHHRHLNTRQVECRRLERRLARLERRLDSDSAEEVAKVQAELAALRVMHETALAAQPRIQGEIRSIQPRIEALHARQSEREAALAAAQERAQAIDEQVAQRVSAAQARKTAAERALAASADEVRELVTGLGERLCLERPESALVAPRMAMIDGCDSATADLERQILERSERVRRIDRAAVARGALLAVGLSAAVGALVWLALRL